VMMDVFERYFHYESWCVCGIPAVTLEGAPADWQKLCEKAAALRVFDLDWWLAHLLPLCNQFARASRGDVDLDHWRAICKLREEYGGDLINGWVAKLFPYLRAFVEGPCNVRNPIFETGKGFQTTLAPSGLSRVPFRWRNLETGSERAMEAIGGLIGVAQDPATLALRPKVAWAVREAEKIDALLARVTKEHMTCPGSRTTDARYLPADLARFYHHTDGAELFGDVDALRCRIVSSREMESLNWGESPEEFGNSRGPDGRIWHRFASLADGSSLAINLDRNRRDPRPKGSGNRSFDPGFSPICRLTTHTQAQPGQNPIVARSFTELLERLLGQGSTLYWLDPAFESYGDAEAYTRRD
jgi:Domain of unknown function (DUF4419)